jgi:hypothetical protein
MCLVAMHQAITAQLVSVMLRHADYQGSTPQARSYIFTALKALSRSDRMAVKCVKPAVGPWFDRFILARRRRRSSALKKPMQALVPVFSGSTGGPVRFFKLCLDYVFSQKKFAVMLAHREDMCSDERCSSE